MMRASKVEGRGRRKVGMWESGKGCDPREIEDGRSKFGKRQESPTLYTTELRGRRRRKVGK
jgi:hypothetical protein